ncbi:hypothetical protein ACAG65_07000 [Halodesulfovibrio aestuarii]|uniref:hypothetical protein n=1 Tax=Halodesulfovibrio aestuarii TaxID=126333 RepID=UPI003522CD59
MEALVLSQSWVSRYLSFLKKNRMGCQQTKREVGYCSLAEPDDLAQARIMTIL